MQNQNPSNRQHISGELSKNHGIDMTVFNEAIKNINKAITDLQNDSNEFRRNFSDILPMMSKLSTIKDLKNLEEVLKTLLEEYKLLAQRKFADKIDTQKNLKLIDTQIKQFINEYIKKSEKNENWM